MSNWKNIRIFVSSTFKDMDVERDLLRAIVEPKLNDFLAHYYCSVEFVDLRHSVKTDSQASMEERERQICAICFDEIDRCAPYFLGLLGHRYGWIPPKGIITSKNTNRFPIECKDLSVTAHEFLHGLENPYRDNHGLVFMRNDSSYKNIDPSDLDNYFETDSLRNGFIQDLRHYFTNNSHTKVVSYDIDLANPNSDSIAKWVETAYQEILLLIEEEYSNNLIKSELDIFIASQASYIKNKTSHAHVRTSELAACKKIIDENDECIISTRHPDVGASEFLFQLYNDYSNKTDSICLLYSNNEARSFKSSGKIIYYWLMQLNHRFKHSQQENLKYDAADDEKLCALFYKTVEELTNDGHKVYVFMECILPILNQLSYHITPVFILPYDDSVEVLRPKMYMLQPYSMETILSITQNLREPVRRQLVKHPQSAHATWLNLAIEQLENLNKIDYITIRKESDSEEAIVKHQIELIKHFPEDIDKMRTSWVDKMCSVFGSRLVNRIIFLVGINPNGFFEEDICQILDCDNLSFTLIRNMLGKNVFKANGRKWCISETHLWKDFHENICLTERNTILTELKQFLSSNPQNQLNDELRLTLAMMMKDIPTIVQIFSEPSTPERESWNKQSFLWMARELPNDFKDMMDSLSMYDIDVTYEFVDQFIRYVKSLLFGGLEEIYLHAILSLKKWLQKLKINGKIGNDVYSLSGDIIACEADYYHHIGNYKSFFDCLQAAISISSNEMKIEKRWTKAYLYYLLRMKGFVKPEYRLDFYRQLFLTYEDNNELIIPRDDDPTTYAIMLLETAEYLAENGETRAGTLIEKAFRVFKDTLCLQQKGTLRTPLKPFDTMRNILGHLSQIYYIYDNTEGIVSLDWLLQTSEDMLNRCDDCKENKGDIAYAYYYTVSALKLSHSYGVVDNKIFNLLGINASLLNGSNLISFTMYMRNESKITNDFIAFVHIYSELLFLLSNTKDKSFELDGFLQKELYGNYTELFTKNNLSFNDELLFILPLIGAKLSNDSCLVPDEIKLPMIRIYASMINVAIEENWDESLTKSIFNSYWAEIDAVNQNNTVKYNFSNNINNLSALSEIVNRNSENRDLFNGFTDCYGLPGNYYNQMWRAIDE